MFFEKLNDLYDIETIASGNAIREINRLQKRYGKARWRKMKGVCEIRLKSGLVVKAELHWYEAHGIGRREFKVKRLVD